MDPWNTTDVGMAEVRSPVEDGSGSQIEEKVVVVSNDGTDEKLPSTVVDWSKRRPRKKKAAQF